VTNPKSWSPTEKQEYFLAAVEDEVLFGGAAGGGKALDLATPIATPDGWRTMADLQPGDDVFDEHGQPCKVLAISEVMHDRPCYELTFSDGSQIVADEQHLWVTYTDKDRQQAHKRTPDYIAKRKLTREKRGTGAKPWLALSNANREHTYLEPPKPTAKTTKELFETLKVGKAGRLNHSIPVAKALDLPEASLTIDPYILGAWLGDGTSANGQFTSADPEIVAEYAKHFTVVKHGGKYAYGTHGLHTLLRQRGLLNNKHIPQEYLLASIDQRLALLQGLMDTDGYCDKRGQCEFSVTRLELAEGALELILSLGIKAVMCVGEAKLNGRVIGPAYSIKFQTHYPAFRLERKLSRQKRDGFRGTHETRYLQSVVRCESRPVKCIKVSSPSHCYLAGRELIQTHNSDALIMDVLGLGEEEPSISIPRFRGLLIRKTFPQLREIIDRTRIIYPLIDPGATYREADKEWLFTSGAKIIFGFCERDPDVLQYQGAEFQWIGIDELGHFATPYVYDYLTSRLRSPDKRLSAKMRASCNPGPKWIMEKFGIKKDGADSMVTLNVNGRFIHRRFISSKLSDNNHLDGTGYLERLMMLPDVERQQLLEGRWDVYNVPGAIYKDQIDESRSNGRIRPLPYDPMLRVHAIWDLGWNDKTSIILVQKGASDVRIIDYIEESHKTLDYYSTLLRERKWNWGEMWLPHDGETRNLQTGRSAKEVLDSQGWNVRITPKLDIESGIRAARMMFGQVYFDADKADVLVDHLYNYRRAINAQTGEATAPVHDNHSHAADAFRYLGVCVGSLTNSEWSKGTLNYANMNYA